MKIQKSQWIVSSALVVIGFIFFIAGLVKGESVLTGPGLALIVVSGGRLISLRKMQKGDKDELDKQRAAKDERTLMIWDKAATVGFGVAFVLLFAAAFIYLIILDMFLEGLVIFGILMIVMISYVLAAWYYSKKL